MVTSNQAQESGLTVPEPSIPQTEIIRTTGPKFRIAGDKIQAAVADLQPEQKSVILWFWAWCRKNDFGTSELNGVLKKPGTNELYSADSIIQLLTGGRIRRGENIEPMLEAIRALRISEDTRAKVDEARSKQVKIGFIETGLYHEFERRCLKARNRQKIQFFFGDSQSGKTENLKEVQRRLDHGSARYFEVPTNASCGGLLQVMAAEFSIPTGLKQSELKDRVFACIDDKMLLIFDEAHRFFESKYSSSGLLALSLIRELYNLKKPGMALSLTNEGRDHFINGPHAKKLQQMWRRRITPLQLPNVTPINDLALFSAAYGLPPASEETISLKLEFVDEHGALRTKTHKDTSLRLQTHTNEVEGLGVWISILQDASDLARELDRPITWAAVLKAACQAQADAEIYK